jgi:hypothetical protein
MKTKKPIPDSLSRKRVEEKLKSKELTAFMTDASKLMCTDVMPLPDQATKVKFRYWDKFIKGQFYWTKEFKITNP